MNTNDIITILIQRGYNKDRANLVANELVNIEPCLQEHINKWLTKGEETEIVYKDVSLKKLIKQNNLKYPAALLTIDWIYKDPESALSILKTFGVSK